jgi:hypothetical protein
VREEQRKRKNPLATDDLEEDGSGTMKEFTLWEAQLPILARCVYVLIYRPNDQTDYK